PFPLSNPCLKPILKEISMKQKKFRVKMDLTCIDHVACIFVPSLRPLEHHLTAAKIVLLFHCIRNLTAIL
ncbi:hypothetical protein L208DRAFT_1394520, partial [Tricholoma matsutake]